MTSFRQMRSNDMITSVPMAASALSATHDVAIVTTRKFTHAELP